MVKKSALIAGEKYLKLIQMKGSKGSMIEYNSPGAQDYLNPCLNLKFEEQIYMFSLRSEMNQLSTNFKRNLKMSPSFCVPEYKSILDNQHLVFCPTLNQNSETNYEKICNGNIQEKIEAFKQTTGNGKIRKILKPSDPVPPVDPLNTVL